MTRMVTIMLTVVLVGILCFGCMGRFFSEGMGAARGASGKLIEIRKTPDLSRYTGLRIDRITVAQGLQAPADMPSAIEKDLAATAEKRGLTPEGQPGLTLSGEIVHYEPSSTTDKAIGPLEEVVVRIKLIDAQSGNLIAEANLVGRSKAISSSGTKNVSAGVAKAMNQWLKQGGLRNNGEKEED